MQPKTVLLDIKMSETIYFTQNGTKLEKRGNSILAIAEKEKRFFPMERIEKIVVFGNVHISNPLFNDFASRKIPVFYYSYGGKFKGTFMPPEKNMGKVRQYQYKTYFDDKRRLDLAKQIVSCASKNKLIILKRYYNKYGKEDINKNIAAINGLISDLETANSIQSLRGFEGIITKNYYSCFQHIFKNYSFEGRNRQPPRDEINCLISFGNSILYNDTSQMAYETGLDHFLGFLHEMEDSKPALILDISELFRQPIIDSLIFEMVNNDMFDDKHFNKKEDFCFLNNYGKDLFIRKYEFKMNKTFLYRKLKEYVSYRNSIKMEFYKLIKYLFEETDEFEGFRIY